MKAGERIVTKIPMTEICNDQGTIEAKRDRYLSLHDFKFMLRQRPVQFVISNSGLKLKWVSIDKCFESWKSEVKPHLVNNPDNYFRHEEFPGEYAYVASEWTGDFRAPVVLLEMYH